MTKNTKLYLILSLIAAMLLILNLFQYQAAQPQKTILNFVWLDQGYVLVREKSFIAKEWNEYEYLLEWRKDQKAEKIEYSLVNAKKVILNKNPAQKNAALRQFVDVPSNPLFSFTTDLSGKYIENSEAADTTALQKNKTIYDTWFAWFGAWVGASIFMDALEPGYHARLAGENSYQFEASDLGPTFIKLNLKNIMQGKNFASTIYEFLEATKLKLNVEDVQNIYKETSLEGHYEKTSLRPVRISMTKKINVDIKQGMVFQGREQRNYEFFWPDFSSIAKLDTEN
ncbi:MAG: hypothetical protein KBD78_02960 [Oligoflexales bacterium]|nr:hypothetical protein [Oligoflexales bacterium]